MWLFVKENVIIKLVFKRGSLSLNFHIGLKQLDGQFTPRWGILPTDSEQLELEHPKPLISAMPTVRKWGIISNNSL